MNLNHFSKITAVDISKISAQHKTPFYLYDKEEIINRCQTILNMPNAFGLTVRYAMKANSTKALLNIIYNEGLKIDASSLNEAKRAYLAGVKLCDIMLTTQEAPLNEELDDLKELMLKGLKYNVCSITQYKNIREFLIENKISVSVRVHPGVGSGESATRNTGDNYSCFGVHLENLPTLLEMVKNDGVVINQVHVHIGSGADPKKWNENIDLELSIVENYFDENIVSVSFGGGLKDARMPDEVAADILHLGEYAKEKLTEFYEKTGRKLKMEIEPGTFIMANSGYCITNIIDKKRTGKDGLNFLLLNGGMEINARPLMYASRHPFYLISKEGELLSTEFNLDKTNTYEAVVVGRCCESGDSQCLDENDSPVPRLMTEPKIGDYLVIGGVGAYCSSMTPFNYNSHQQIAEVLVDENKEATLIRKRQDLSQIIQNEL